ncbi:uncharacterized protein B0H64DRAFT_411653 [Chaetomium fimeti]|uniref:Uncharacterized protein n=1 Tax=Chaetomium fimeti TaxID=1854472 RepID=A0AAE0H5Y6_9PEZI|nr:hypothetical protein B0H64DRAFT_411653 [Chaetomium fimeti]
MGNESSRPEQPDGRSRSLSPLPRDDQLSLDNVDDWPHPPSTMPASFKAGDEGSGPPGARGSLAWRRRRRRSRGLSPESTRAPSPSSPPQDRIVNASQPVRSARAASPEHPPRPATQPTPSTRKRVRETYFEKKRKAELKEAAAAAHIIIDKREAELEDLKKRTRRSIAPSPFPLEDAEQSLDESASASDAEEAAPSERPSSSKQAGSTKKDKGNGKDAIRDAIREEDTAIADRSIPDDEPPPSTQPRGKRGRRDSNSKSRKKQKSRSSSLGLDEMEAGEASNELLGQSASNYPEVGARPDNTPASEDYESGYTGTTTHSQSAVLNEHLSDDGASPEPSRASAIGSQRSHSDSGYGEADGQGPLMLKPGMGMDNTNGSPRSGDDQHSTADGGASEDGDDGMSVMSEPQHSPVASDSDNYDGASASSSHNSEGPPVASDSDDDDEANTPSLHDPEDSPAASDPDNPGNTSAPSPHNPESASTRLDSSVKSSRHSAKRQAKLPFFPRQEEENVQAFAELPHEDATSPPQLRRSKRTRQPRPIEADAAAEDSEEEPSTGKSQYRSGPFSPAERDRITRAVERFREDEDLTQEEINQVIHDNPQASGRPIHRQLWATIQDACPLRPRRKLISWCRQHFHNWAGRGAWTQAQDDELADLIEKHGKKWSHIAGLINRYSGDVRDRWRNYLVCRETVKTDIWSEGEEERFRELVENSIDKIRQRIGEDSRKPPEELLNWLSISEAMGHTRSRLQCIQKWKRICESQPLADIVPTVLPSGNSWRLEKARDELQRITTSDKYRLMCTVRDSGVGTDTKINWKQIVNGTFHKRYERQTLVVTWGRLRTAVPDWEWMTTRDCARYLCEMYEREGNFGSAEDPGVENDAPVSTKKGRKGKKTHRLVSADDLASGSQDQLRAGSEPTSDTQLSPVADEENNFASAESRRKSDKKRRKAKSDTTQSQAAAETADEDVEMEDSMHAESHAKSAKTRPPYGEKEQSPELDTVARESSSPSVEAQASRTRRRERRESTAEETGAKEKGKESSSPKAASSKVAKRARRESLQNGDAEDLRSKKRKTTSLWSKSKANGASQSNGKSSSVVSSDMEDMEDIPATLPWSGSA